jgi:putative hydroxymethylpyrimidine transport system substrate-binding protein
VRSRLLALAVVAAGVAVAVGVAFGARSGGAATHVDVTLDWTPNPDHVGLYEAQQTGLFSRAGLDVSIHAPSDPTAPLKLVAAGRSDLAVSYEQELFFAAAKKLPVVAVAAVVPQPLNSFMSIDPHVHSLQDLRGKSIGITGVPSDYATLASARLTGHVKVVSVGYNLLPALLAHRVDAVLGVYRNVEGVQLQLRGLHPTIIPVDRAGVPSYDELVLVASASRLHDSSYRSTVQRFVSAFLAGTADARAHPARALAILKRVTAADPTFLARATPLTLRLLAGPDGVGCVSVGQWQRFGDWMLTRGLLKHRVAVSRVVTARFLPRRCRSAAARG